MINISHMLISDIQSISMFCSIFLQMSSQRRYRKLSSSINLKVFYNMLSKIADFYDDEVDQAVKTLTDMIEPFMLVFLGVVIGGLVIAMYLPIFKMAAAVG